MQVTCDENFKIGFNRVYDRNLANGLRKIYKSHEHLFEGLQDKGAYQLDLAANCKTIRDFDDAITRVSFGWPSVDAYYAGETPVSTVLNAVIIVLKPARSKISPLSWIQFIRHEGCRCVVPSRCLPCKWALTFSEMH